MQNNGIRLTSCCSARLDPNCLTLIGLPGIKLQRHKSILMNTFKRMGKWMPSKSQAFKVFACITIGLLMPYAIAQGQGSWGGYLQSILWIAVLFFWVLVVVFGYVIYLALHELLGTLIEKSFIRIPIAIALTFSTLFGLKTYYAHHKETKRQEEVARNELISTNKVRAQQRVDTELRKRYGIARLYLDKVCPGSVSKVSNRIDGKSGLKLGEGIRANGSANGWYSNETVPDAKSAPKWTTSGVDVARAAVLSGIAFVETGYLRVGHASWWERHPEARKREQATKARNWPGTSESEGIIALEDIEPWAKYQLIVYDTTTPEDNRHWTSRIQLVLERIDSGERIAEYTSLHAYSSLNGRNLDELALPVACSLEEEKYKSTGNKTPPHWNPFAYFLTEVVEVEDWTK